MYKLYRRSSRNENTLQLANHKLYLKLEQRQKYKFLEVLKITQNQTTLEITRIENVTNNMFSNKNKQDGKSILLACL